MVKKPQEIIRLDPKKALKLGKPLILEDALNEMFEKYLDLLLGMQYFGLDDSLFIGFKVSITPKLVYIERTSDSGSYEVRVDMNMVDKYRLWSLAYAVRHIDQFENEDYPAEAKNIVLRTIKQEFSKFLGKYFEEQLSPLKWRLDLNDFEPELKNCKHSSIIRDYLKGYDIYTVLKIQSRD